jgi:1,4-dihydroxy-2-naphthoate octaprenyltransferase
MAATPHSTDDRTTASPLDRHASPVADHSTATGRRNGMAVAAMILGILSIPAILIPILAFILGILAIVLGAVAKGQIKKTGMTNGGQAMAGIVCGAIGVVGAIVIVAIAASSAA